MRKWGHAILYYTEIFCSFSKTTPAGRPALKECRVHRVLVVLRQLLVVVLAEERSRQTGDGSYWTVEENSHQIVVTSSYPKQPKHWRLKPVRVSEGRACCRSPAGVARR